jgi:threonine dehydrogenase-like Zn-dependent dehydrogenase
MSDEEATLVVTAGTAMYALTELGGLVAGESVCVTGPGPIGLMAVAVAKALGADAVVNVRKTPDVVVEVKRLNGGKGVDYVVECSAAVRMVNRGGKVCLADSPAKAKCRSTSRTSYATTSTFTAFAARAGAPRTARRRSCARSASTLPRSTPTRSPRTICRPPCVRPRIASMTPSRWW